VGTDHRLEREHQPGLLLDELRELGARRRVFFERPSAQYIANTVDVDYRCY